MGPVIALYLAATCVTGFLSSHPFVRMFGVLSLLSFVATYLVYTRAFVSVWCFFAAILSLLIFLHLRYRQLGGLPTRPHAGIATCAQPSEPGRSGPRGHTSRTRSPSLQGTT